MIGADLNEREDEWETRESFEQEVQGRQLRYQEKRVPISYCALSRTRNACGHLTSFCFKLGKKVNHLDHQACRGKENALAVFAINEKINVLSRDYFADIGNICTYFKNILKIFCVCENKYKNIKNIISRIFKKYLKIIYSWKPKILTLLF